MLEEKIKCPKCSSTQIHVSKKGFGIGKAVIGTLTGGVLLGALAGSIGKNKLFLTCLKCNHNFKIGEKYKKPTNYENKEKFVGYEVTKTYKCKSCGKTSTLSDTSKCPKCGAYLSTKELLSTNNNNIKNKSPKTDDNNILLMFIIAVIFIAIASSLMVWIFS